MEKPFQIGEILKQGCHLDIDAELKLVASIKAELMHSSGNLELERKTMKKLGLERFKHIAISRLSYRLYTNRYKICTYYYAIDT